MYRAYIIPTLEIDAKNHCGIIIGEDTIEALDDRYSNLFLNDYINRHVHAEYLK